MKFLKKTLIFFLTSFCMLVLMEFYFTQTEIMQPISGSVDSEIGFAFLDEQDFVMFNEGFCIGHIKNYGYLGNYPQEKKANTFRIAILGDSYVEGLQVFERDHFVNLLENTLNKNTDIKIEVLNFGLAGYNLADMYAYDQHKSADFKPDLKLFFIEEKDLKQIQNKNNTRPYLEIEKKVLKMNYSFTNTIKYQIYTKGKLFLSSGFGSLAIQLYHNIEHKKTLSILFDKFYFDSKKQQTTKFSTKQDNEFPKVSKLILQELKKQNVILVYRNTISQSSMDYIEKEIGLPTINLNDTLNAMKQNDIDPNYWKVTKQRGHWNHDGHKAVGIFLADKIQQMNLINKKK